MLLWLASITDSVPEGQRAELAEMERIVRQLLEEVRRIALELRPQMLDDLGLPSALNELAAGFARRTGIAVERSFDQPLPHLTSQAELALYRVAQESLTNVARHAHAASVRLSLSQGEDSVIMRIVDDGHGIASGDLEGNGGLRGMRERAVFVGGALAIEPGPDGGVEVRLEVPSAERESTE